MIPFPRAIYSLLTGETVFSDVRKLSYIADEIFCLTPDLGARARANITLAVRELERWYRTVLLLWTNITTYHPISQTQPHPPDCTRTHTGTGTRAQKQAPPLSQTIPLIKGRNRAFCDAVKGRWEFTLTWHFSLPLRLACFDKGDPSLATQVYQCQQRAQSQTHIFGLNSQSHYSECYWPFKIQL